MKNVIAKIEIKRNYIDEFISLKNEIQEKTKQEKGCVIYDLYQDVELLERFVFVEKFEDEESFDKHIASEYYKAFFAKVSKMLAKEPIVEIY